MNSEKKKELQNAYRNRAVVGGVYCIECSGNGRRWIRATENIAAIKNRFNFAVATKSAPDPGMRNECDEFGIKSFSLTVLEELEKKETQTDKEFSDDLEALLQLWLEKYEINA
ncbi:MAG: GIY-YIG nuclease family protein [Clostridiales bacterium]|nr:GIY-YIG nuclease family protein [Clostridiales bacterium]